VGNDWALDDFQVSGCVSPVVSFSVNNILYSVIDSLSFCEALPIVVNANIPPDITVDSLKWYLNGIEQVAQRDNLVWHDTLLAGNYIIAMQLNELDTLFTTIFIYPNKWVYISDTICDGESYNFNGTILYTAGTYINTLATIYGCDSIVTLTLILGFEPSFMAVPEVQWLSNGEINFINFTDSLLANNPDYHFYWDFGDGTIDSTHISPQHTYTDWGDYNVTLYIYNRDCQSSITHRITIEAELEFPNTITPNGDGLNDVFAIKNLNTQINPNEPYFRENTLSIFNRWGRKVYEAANYDTYVKNGDIFVGQKAFDGKNCPDGTYYYTFIYKGKIQTAHYNGTLIIIRNAK
jgi:gliding motility-associated-like protein